MQDGWAVVDRGREETPQQFDGFMSSRGATGAMWRPADRG